MTNVMPLCGAWLLDWDIFTVLLLFWFENVVIGIFNLIKMIQCPSSVKERLVTMSFFTIHYGAFCTGHLVVLFSLFGLATRGGFLPIWLDAADYIARYSHYLWLSIAAIISLQGFSFMEWLKQVNQPQLKKLMSEPYQRIVTIHLALIFGGILSKSFSHHALILIALIFFKIMMDYKELSKRTVTRPTDA